MPATRPTRLFPIGEVSRPGMSRRIAVAVGAVADATTGVQSISGLVVARDVAMWPVVESFDGDHRDDAVTDDVGGCDRGELVDGLGEAEVEAVVAEVGFQYRRPDRWKCGTLHALRYVHEHCGRVVPLDHRQAARRVAQSAGAGGYSSSHPRMRS